MADAADQKPAYVIAHITVTEPASYRAYEKGFFPVLKPYGAHFLTYDDNVTILEGERADGRTVLIEFPSEEIALTWWNSKDYQQIADLRRAGAITNSIIMLHAMPDR
ncbi:MAG: DUF1330 domain-containing protein [Pseudomonadota bacterium]